MDLIRLQDLSIGYKKGKDCRIVMSGISADIQSGRLTCLIGRNGAGKSTLLRTISAFQPKFGGDIIINGKSIAEYSRTELSKLIGVVLTDRLTIRNLTVKQLVAMGRMPYTGFFGALTIEDESIVEEQLRLVGITNLAERMTGELSDGERQKMMIAKALAQQTTVIYLDEPTSFLDYASKVDILQLLHRLCAEEHKTIFLSTHDLELALQIADNLWVMTPDGIVTGTPKELADNGTLANFINKPGLQFDSSSMSIRIIR